MPTTTLRQALESARFYSTHAGELASIAHRAGLIQPFHPRTVGSAAKRLLRKEHRLSILLHVNALERPDKAAVVDAHRTLTYAALDRRVNRLVRVLQHRGLRPGGNVAVLLPNRAEFLELALACHRIGASFTPIGTRLKDREISYILENSGATVCVVDTAHRTELPAAAARLHLLVVRSAPDDPIGDPSTDYERVLSEASAAPVPRQPPCEDDAVIIYTSGTTGRPKGARRNLRANSIGEVLMMIGGFDLTRDERFYLCTPLYHSAPWAFSNMVMALGGTLVLAERWDGLDTLRDMQRHHVTGMLAVPTLIRRWLDLDPVARQHAHPRRLTKVISAGAKFPARWKVEASTQIGEIFYDFYGATELGVITISGPRDTRLRPETVGRVMPYVDLRLVDEQGRDVPHGTRGELYARGQNFAGYLSDEATVVARKLEDYFSVGDVAVRDAEGYLQIVDRVADMVVSGGVNLYPAEIEDVVRELPGVGDVAVIGVPDEEFGEALHAFVVRSPGHEDLEPDAILAYCRAQLAGYKRPRGITFVDELPRSPQGKVLKRELRDRWTA